MVLYISSPSTGRNFQGVFTFEMTNFALRLARAFLQKYRALC